MADIDPTFILPESYRPKDYIDNENDIPLIDLSAITNRETSPDPEALASLAAKVGDACRRWGFFTVVNHGVPPGIRARMMAVLKEFFALPVEEKRKVRRGSRNTAGYHDGEHSKDLKDWKEVFDFMVKDGAFMPATHEPDDAEIVQFLTPWPEKFPQLREACQEYAAAVQGLFFNVLELVCMSLGVPPKRLHSYFDDQASFARLNHYPPCPQPELVLGTGSHKDPSALTVLAQEEVEGLDVQRKTDGAWVRVKPIPDSFVINVGDILEVWSNNLYESVEHRVMTNASTDRYSLPIFFHPSHYVTMKPLEELINEENPPKYPEYNGGKWLNLRMYNNYKKQGFYMRMTDYKITA